jgi:hypothetical protein
MQNNEGIAKCWLPVKIFLLSGSIHIWTPTNKAKRLKAPILDPKNAERTTLTQNQARQGENKRAE